MTLSIHRLFLLAAAFSAAALIAHAQAPAPAAVNTVGVVTKIDVSAREIMLRTDAGSRCVHHHPGQREFSQSRAR